MAKNKIKRFFGFIYHSYIPNKRDNLKQVTIKSVFIISLTTLIVSSVFILRYFGETRSQNRIIDDDKNIWYSYDIPETDFGEETEIDQKTDTDSTPVKQMQKKNPDFKGWVKLSNSKIDNPIYQTKDNDYYLNHNSRRQKSVYGALFFDCNNVVTQEKIDKNLVVFGHEMKNGSMFGQLKKLRELKFYKNNPTVEFTVLNRKGTYKIYAVFVLNSKAKDDGGYIYNIYRNEFSSDAAFDEWVAEAKQRSLVNTSVDVKNGDDILTLVTCSDDFKDSRLVVMARKTRKGESKTVDISSARLNKNPKYPKAWYKAKDAK